MALIESVRCTPPSAVVDEEIFVEVIAPGGQAYANREHGHISINGIPGSSQRLRFTSAGAKRIQVFARVNGNTEHVVHPVQISAAQGSRPPLVIRAEYDPERPTAAKFIVESSDARLRRSKPPNETRRRGLIAAAEFPHPAPRAALSGSPFDPATYEWDFG